MEDIYMLVGNISHESLHKAFWINTQTHANDWSLKIHLICENWFGSWRTTNIPTSNKPAGIDRKWPHTNNLHKTTTVTQSFVISCFNVLIPVKFRTFKNAEFVVMVTVAPSLTCRYPSHIFISAVRASLFLCTAESCLSPSGTFQL